mmetsp:Transcript_24008/g.77242  ORF Transcript_24008/g.77242 Transcript_24008/m.77242 type:complete len:210 (-) Transcript_24008:405-1034(-)
MVRVEVAIRPPEDIADGAEGHVGGRPVVAEGVVQLAVAAGLSAHWPTRPRVVVQGGEAVEPLAIVARFADEERLEDGGQAVAALGWDRVWPRETVVGPLIGRSDAVHIEVAHHDEACLLAAGRRVDSPQAVQEAVDRRSLHHRPRRVQRPAVHNRHEGRGDRPRELQDHAIAAASVERPASEVPAVDHREVVAHEDHDAARRAVVRDLE